jgi:hypothetical protein
MRRLTLKFLRWIIWLISTNVQIDEAVEKYEKDNGGQIFWLKNRQPKKWRNEEAGKDFSMMELLGWRGMTSEEWIEEARVKLGMTGLEFLQARKRLLAKDKVYFSSYRMRWQRSIKR